MNNEIQLYEQIAQYMNLQYPTVPYHFDLSGLWTPSHQARNLYGRLNKRAWPDLFIPVGKLRYGPDYEPSTSGMFLELKREGTPLYKKDGSMRANPHHQEQAIVLESLRQQGYFAAFAIGFDEAKCLIDEYLTISPLPQRKVPLKSPAISDGSVF